MRSKVKRRFTIFFKNQLIPHCLKIAITKLELVMNILLFLSIFSGCYNGGSFRVWPGFREANTYVFSIWGFCSLCNFTWHHPPCKENFFCLWLPWPLYSQEESLINWLLYSRLLGML